jgi:hypothetical protein
MITYAELLKNLEKLDPKQLNMTATIHLTDVDEYFGVSGFTFTNETECDVLDDKHPIMSIT